MARGSFTPRYSLAFAKATAAKVTVANNANLSPETNNKFSWSCWFFAYDTKVTSVEPRLFDKAQHFLGILTSPQTSALANKVELALTSSSTLAKFYGSTIIQPNRWYHVAATYNAGTVALYLNGVAETITSTAAAPTLDASSGSNLFIANRSGNSRNFPGKIALPRMFQNKALTAAEVATLYHGGEVTDGLVLRYDFDEQQASTLTDKSGNGYTGTVSGVNSTINSWFSESVMRQPTAQVPEVALNFVPASSEVVVADTAILRPEATNAFTWSAWVYPLHPTFNDLPFIVQKSSHYICIMGEKSPPNQRNQQFALEVANESDGLATEYWSSMRLTMGQWHHVVASFAGGTTLLYIDGHKDPVTIVNNNWVSPLESTVGEPLNFGNRHTALNRNFPGYIGKIRYYNVVLTDDEAYKVFAEDSVARGLVGKWNFDENSGSTATDTSGYGHDGTISNATWVTFSTPKYAANLLAANGDSLVDAAGEDVVSGSANRESARARTAATNRSAA